MLDIIFHTWNGKVWWTIPAILDEDNIGFNLFWYHTMDVFNSLKRKNEKTSSVCLAHAIITTRVLLLSFYSLRRNINWISRQPTICRNEKKLDKDHGKTYAEEGRLFKYTRIWWLFSGIVHLHMVVKTCYISSGWKERLGTGARCPFSVTPDKNINLIHDN